MIAGSKWAGISENKLHFARLHRSKPARATIFRLIRQRFLTRIRYLPNRTHDQSEAAWTAEGGIQARLPGTDQSGATKQCPINKQCLVSLCNSERERILCPAQF
jgi:hypothetical protein